MNDNSGAREQRLAQAQDEFDRASSGHPDMPKADWLAAYYCAISIDALSEREPADLAQITLSHLQLARTRRPGKAVCKIGRPCRKTAQSQLASLWVCVDDMPFLVDTLVIAVRAAGAAVDWTAHPVVRVERDAKYQLIGLSDNGNAVSEAWIYLEFDRLSDDKAYAQLEDSIQAHLQDLRLVVSDYQVMDARIQLAIKTLVNAPASNDGARLERAEAAEFLRWLSDGHFTFLASAETRFHTDEKGRARSIPDAEAGLGLARKGARFADIDALVAPREELDKYAESPRVVVLTKAAQRSTVHHSDYMDHVAVRYFGDDGEVAGIIRVIGLFSSDAYVERPWDIPLIRRRVESVMQRSRLRAGSHSAKNLREILHGLPRDELFQFGENELFDTCMGISALRDRHPLRLFLRRDRYGRFFSALIYLPRERFSRELRDHLAQQLQTLCKGHSVERKIDFLRGGLTRVHVVVHTSPGTDLELDADEIEQRLRDIARPWRDQLLQALRASCKQADTYSDDALGLRFGDAFASSYIERVGPDEAAEDVRHLSRLSASCRLLPSLQLQAPGRGRLKLYAWSEPKALAEILPVLENFGVRAIRQDPEAVNPGAAHAENAVTLWIQDFEVELPEGEGADRKEDFEQTLLSVLEGRSEDDAMNRLALAGGLDGRQIIAVRCLAKYVNQIGLPYGRADIDRMIAFNAPVASNVLAYFEARFALSLDSEERDVRQHEAREAAQDAINEVSSLDADRILRALLSVVDAGLRTNFYQKDKNGEPKSVISLKLDPQKIPELPLPRPMFEIWVYAPRLEGVHLRGGRVARGGLRWSDRNEDFRTEVLGLMKAQQVKNAVIIPVGAKGGFVVKNGPPPSDRDAWLADGKDCYQNFLRAMLDVTDNRDGERIVPPEDVVRHDGDDSYLVVAADKGTASFSDTANGIAQEYGFWLDDAFASGGSAGYDHKKMGITARGAWESVKRHFRELATDIQREDFTVVGIGDMSGDVFGNGMLLSEHIRLIAAFDHRHIFIDPQADAATGFKERSRLFALPRSSWADYDETLLSEGGGIYPRTLKKVTLSPQAMQALGTDESELTPAQLMQVILKAPIDLLWNGGVGTYVKASTQSHDEVRDRANNSLRVDGRALRARVVGEGGNLGLTQAGRIEYALHGASGKGGRINTDAIDNSGGVHSSDREVNIKIPLNLLLRQSSLQIEDRNRLLESMTPELVKAVLRDNEVQSGAISLIEFESATRLDEHEALIRSFEREGRLDRALEGLPDDDQIQERRSKGLGLQRPEIAVLVAYSKIALFESAQGSAMVRDAFFEHSLLDYFPKEMVKRFEASIRDHDLRAEIISTICANSMVNRMGVSLAWRMAENHGVEAHEVLHAYAAADALLGADRYWNAIEGLDHKIPAAVQYSLMTQVVALLRHVLSVIVTSRMLDRSDIQSLLDRYQSCVSKMSEQLPGVLPGDYRDDFDRHLSTLEGQDVPRELSQMLARARALGSVLDIADLSQQQELAFEETLPVYFQVGDMLHMPWLLSAIIALQPSDSWQALARTRLREDAYRLHREVCERVLACDDGAPQDRLGVWRQAHEARLSVSLRRLSELRASGASDYAALTVAVRELHELQALRRSQ
tara:strand:- start:31499 stop:36352 length:4854 start_codon:yes stop_codon:yes gene_type:complete